MLENNTTVWRQSLIQREASLQDAIKNLDITGLQIALIVDSNNVLLGTVTDGDVRRALLRGIEMTSSVDRVMFSSPLVVMQEMGSEMALDLMRANKIHQLPVVNERRQVVGLYVLDDIIAPAARDNALVIMAGGFGKRLRPYTEDCPKPMLKIAGKPMLEHIIVRAKTEGFRNFILSIHYLGHLIEEYFGDGSEWNVSIKYLKENTPLGTAGALSLLRPIPSLPFIVTNGDVLTDIRYSEILDFHLNHEAQATMAVRQHEWQHPFGVVKTQGIEITGFEEKPVYKSHVNAGIYVLDPDVLSILNPGGACDMPTLFEKLRKQEKQIIAYPMHEPWLDVGRPDDLEMARASKK